MADQEQPTGWLETLLGFVIIIAIIVGVVYLVRLSYAKFYKPAPVVVSLSAYFVDESGAPLGPESRSYGEHSHLKVKGDVYQAGKPINGNARVTITSTSKDNLFQESISIPFQNGHFETDDPAFRAIRPGVPAEIKAEITGPGSGEIATINLNSKPPVDKSALEWALGAGFVVLSVVFFVAFTGKKTAWKNQTAIIFSYVIIGIFLAVPLLAPVMLVHTFPDAVDAMIGAPAGLINTQTPNQQDGESQWALNIGGYSYRAKAPASPSAPKNLATTPAPVPAPAATQTSSTPAAPNNDASTTGVAQPPTSDASQSSAKVDTSNPPAPLPTTQALNPESSAPVVKVQGGLVIPLYVIILSVIGGAINMTRKVPAFQKEGEESDFRLGRPVSRLGTAVMKVARMGKTAVAATHPEETGADKQEDSTQQQAGIVAKNLATAALKPDDSLEKQARAIEAQLDPLLTEQIQRNCESDVALADIRNLLSKMEELYSARKSGEPVLKFNSFEDWAASHPRLRELLRGSWRVELLNQYMYLISAPFLAIVTYYVLDLLGLSKAGVVVVLSFSVGLISEKIVSWILGIATGYMRTDTGNATKVA
ncbi:MAG: hypothetical protein WBM04_20865 [Candidatus Korobacteraceae bacterium]